MISICAKNITDAFYQGLECFDKYADTICTGKKYMKELSPVCIEIKNPLERYLVVPYRNNNVFATIAETLWVLGGRNDVSFLQKYLSNANKFSDDGITWRTGYGYRIRSHFYIDQFKEAYKTLKKLSISNQANMVIFDPSEDLLGEKRNNPCTIWVHFAIRDNKLNTFVTMRANDIIWGFSHINAFEWSVFSELLAHWLGVEVGAYYQFNASWRIYHRHLEKYREILKNKIEMDIYAQKSNIKDITIDIPYDVFDDYMGKFFDIESLFEKENFEYISYEISQMKSEFLKNCLWILYMYTLIKSGDENNYIKAFGNIHSGASKISIAEFMLRQNISTNAKKIFSKFFDLW